MLQAVGTIVAAVVGLIAMIVVFGLLLSWPLSAIWNGCLVPAVSGLHEVGVLQMWGILVLCGCLFKSSSVSSSKS